MEGTRECFKINRIKLPKGIHVGGKVKTHKCGILVLFLILVFSGYGFADGEKSLADIYRTGKVRFVKEFEITDESLPEGEFLSKVFAVAMDDDGAIYACDHGENNIKKFDANGKFVKIIGKEGQGPGDFGRPLNMEIAKDRIVVWDSMNMRISVLNLDGEFIKNVHWDFMGKGWLYGIKALPDGKIVFETRVTHRGGPTRPEEWFLLLYSYDMEPEKEIFRKECLVRKNIIKPRNMNIPIPFSARVHWDVSPDGNVIIGFSEKYEVEIHDPVKGKLSSFSHEYEPVEVTKEDEEQYFAGIITSSTSSTGAREVKQGAPDYIVDNTDFPRYMPAYNDIKCDSEGNIWVRAFRKDREEANRSFDAFDKNGRFIDKVIIEGDRPYPGRAKIKKRGFCIVETDKDGYQKIVKYRISE